MDATHQRGRRGRRYPGSTALLAAIGAVFVGGAAASQASCGGSSPGTCDAACSNIVAKCNDSQTAAERKSNCLATCNQNAAPIPAACASQRGDLLSCVASADALDCVAPQESALCVQQLTSLGGCEGAAGYGSMGTGSGFGFGSTYGGLGSGSGSGS